MTETSSDCGMSLRAHDAELRVAYLAAVEAHTVRWQGETVPLRRLRQGLESPDRRTREGAWRLETGRWLADGPLFDRLWRSMVPLRAEMASLAGMKGYPALRRQELGYPPTVPGAGQRAQLAVEEFVTAVLVRLHERRRLQFGLRTIRPWDLLAAPPGFPADPLFATKADALDAVNALLRLHYEHEGVVGVPTTTSDPLTSDAHVEDALARFGEAWSRPTTSGLKRAREELENVAAAALTLQVLHGDEGARGAASGPTALARSRIRHLERSLLRWTFGAMIDAFEEWAYAHPTQILDEGAVGATWSSLWLRFLPAVDWAGLEEALAREWQRHGPLFLKPSASMVRTATELELFRSWTQATDSRAWFQHVGVFGQPSGGDYEPIFVINEMDLLDIARWMEDAIVDLERSVH
jgi:hypothetical protein